MLQTTMTSLKAKKNSKKGFTLMEMLIVVAIIAILVAVSIPVFTSQLTKAKEATDAANQRAAKAVAASTYLADETRAGQSGNYIYDAANGKLVTTAVAGYGKSSGVADDVLQVSITSTGDIYMSWVAAATTGSATALTTNGTNLVTAS